ncbi:MAG: hypothetical protein ACYC3I_10920 [Gemmataceae bacterium]
MTSTVCPLECSSLRRSVVFLSGFLGGLGVLAVGAAQDKLKETSYYPLQVGATWHYRAGAGKFTMRVARHEKVGDTLCALLETKRDGKVVGSEHLAVTADGVYRHDLTAAGAKSVTQTLKPPMLLLKLPPKKGDGWKIDSKGDGKNFRGGFQVSEQEITVPAGKYKTFRVASQDLEVNALKPSITTFFAEGVGMVKQIIEVGDAKVEIELDKYEAGGK